jgi:hypothetical protein
MMSSTMAVFAWKAPTALPAGGAQVLAPERLLNGDGQIIIARGAKDEKLV